MICTKQFKIVFQNGAKSEIEHFNMLQCYRTGLNLVAWDLTQMMSPELRISFGSVQKWWIPNMSKNHHFHGEHDLLNHQICRQCQPRRNKSPPRVSPWGSFGKGLVESQKYYKTQWEFNLSMAKQHFEMLNQRTKWGHLEHNYLKEPECHSSIPKWSFWQEQHIYHLVI